MREDPTFHQIGKFHFEALCFQHIVLPFPYTIVFPEPLSVRKTVTIIQLLEASQPYTPLFLFNLRRSGTCISTTRRIPSFTSSNLPLSTHRQPALQYLYILLIRSAILQAPWLIDQTLPTSRARHHSVSFSLQIDFPSRSLRQTKAGATLSKLRLEVWSQA